MSGYRDLASWKMSSQESKVAGGWKPCFIPRLGELEGLHLATARLKCHDEVILEDVAEVCVSIRESFSS
jgi:hypothetical protein